MYPCVKKQTYMKLVPHVFAAHPNVVDRAAIICMKWM